MTIRDWLQSAKVRLADAGFESSAMESQLLAGHAMLVDRAWLLSHSEEQFPELAGEHLLARRLSHEPLAYILGWREFYGRRFSVGPGVLVPRHETELLVESVLERLRLGAFPHPRVLDLGTGSGCIAISLKLEFPEASVFASDISGAALEIASRNAMDLGAGVWFVQSNRFEKLGGQLFDVIATNPPYIGLSESLPIEVSQFEPREALFSGPGGLEFYDALSIEAGDYLAPVGIMAMEVGHIQASHVKSLFIGRGWRHVETRSDLSNIPRVVICAKSDTNSTNDDT